MATTPGGGFGHLGTNPDEFAPRLLDRPNHSRARRPRTTHRPSVTNPPTPSPDSRPLRKLGHFDETWPLQGNTPLFDREPCPLRNNFQDISNRSKRRKRRESTKTLPPMLLRHSVSSFSRRMLTRRRGVRGERKGNGTTKSRRTQRKRRKSKGCRSIQPSNLVFLGVLGAWRLPYSLREPRAPRETYSDSPQRRRNERKSTEYCTRRSAF